MNNYQPTLDQIRFVYDYYNAKNVGIKHRVTARVNAKESLTEVSGDYYDSIKTVETKFKPGLDVNEPVAYDCVKNAKVKILDKVNVPYDPKNPELCKNELRKLLAPNYTVKTTVYQPDGSLGGQDTKTIASSGEIEII